MTNQGTTTQFSIPEFVNRSYTGRFINITVPTICSKCFRNREPTYKFFDRYYKQFITLAYCQYRCSESYEDFRIQSLKFKNGDVGTISFRPLMESWQPDTRVGSGFTSSDGMNCAMKKCNEFVPFAAPNQMDGKTFICRGCRK